jgi:integrase
VAGKQRWKGGFTKRKDAENYLNAQVRRVHDGTYQAVTPMPMSKLLEAWDRAVIDTGVKQGTIKPSTARSYRSMVRTHLEPAFSTMRSDQLTSHRVMKWARSCADLTDAGTLAPKTYNNLVNLLSVILAWARHPAQRYLAHDPLDGVKRLPRRTLERLFLEPDQIARLLKAAATPPAAAIVVLGVYAGLRRGEICALRWDEIDWGDGGHGRIWVRRAVSGGTVTTPKTKGSVRMVDVPQTVLTTLRAYQASKKGADADYLFQTAEGSPVDPDNLDKRIFKPLVERAKLPGVGLHTLRHTFASLLINAGESIKYVSRQLGHASIHITADTYGHLFRETSIAAMGRLNDRAAAVQATSDALPSLEEMPAHVM